MIIELNIHINNKNMDILMKFKKSFLAIIYIVITGIITSCSSSKYNAGNNTDNQLGSVQYNNKNTLNFQENMQFQMHMQKLQTDNIIYFSLDQYNILPQFFHVLDNHANFLRDYPLYQVKIEGHADERGTPEYNIALGERRANSVKEYLQSQGVLSEQMFIVSYGKEKPIALEHNEQAYSKNRRVVLIYK